MGTNQNQDTYCAWLILSQLAPICQCMPRLTKNCPLFPDLLCQNMLRQFPDNKICRIYSNGAQLSLMATGNNARREIA